MIDIVIHPNYQSKEISKLFEYELQKRLEGYNFITLTAAPNKEKFYQK